MAALMPAYPNIRIGGRNGEAANAIQNLLALHRAPVRGQIEETFPATLACDTRFGIGHVYESARPGVLLRPCDGFRQLLTDQGMDTDNAGAICRQLEVFAARTLYEPKCPELPSGFVAAVNKAQEISHALAH